MTSFQTRFVNWKSFFWIGIFLFLIIPFFLSCFFIHPLGDDFLFSETSREYGSLKAQALFYDLWLSRYSSTALLCSLNPLLLKSLTLYRLLPVILIISMGISLQFIINRIFNKTLKPWQTMTFILSLLAVFFMIMPSTAEGLYWMTGSYTYTFAIPITLYWLVCINNLLNVEAENADKRKKIIVFIQTALATIFVAGFNEISMLTLAVVVLSILAYRMIFLRKFNIWLFLF